MAESPEKVCLNLGCGFKKLDGFINVDGFSACEPDILLDLNSPDWPWDNESVDIIAAFHIFEHLEDWWQAFLECGRILKPGGILEIRVPDESFHGALTYRDHLHVFSLNSFHGTQETLAGRKCNAWFAEQQSAPFVLKQYIQVPFKKYNWFPGFLLRFCANHLRNFIWEQRFIFQRV